MRSCAPRRRCSTLGHMPDRSCACSETPNTHRKSFRRSAMHRTAQPRRTYRSRHNRRSDTTRTVTARSSKYSASHDLPGKCRPAVTPRRPLRPYSTLTDLFRQRSMSSSSRVTKRAHEGEWRVIVTDVEPSARGDGLQPITEHLFAPVGQQPGERESHRPIGSPQRAAALHNRVGRMSGR